MMEIYLLVECYQERRFNIAAYYSQSQAINYKRYLEKNVVHNIDGVKYEIERIVVM